MQLIKDKANDIRALIEKKLFEINAEQPVQLAQASFQIVNKGLRQLMDEKEKYSFGHKEEEIEFFKILRPSICQQRIYFIELYHLLIKMPIMDTDKMIAHLKRKLDKCQRYFDHNKEFFAYYRARQTHLDQAYFTSNPDTPIPLEKTCDCTVCNATAYSNIIAKFQAYERIMTYIKNEIYNLTHPQPKINTQQVNHLEWTDTKVALIELGRAIFACGAINHGKADLKSIIKAFEQAFNIDLGNHYGAFSQNMLIRKNACPYLKKLMAALEKYMIDAN